MKLSPLNNNHVSLGAKLVSFAGWQMPIQYTSIIDEHACVREKVGIFDVSHMGVIDITGPDSEAFIDSLSTNKIVGKKEGTATYTVFCNEDGGTVDDLIVYRLGAEKFFVVVNASNREKDLAHIQKFAEKFNVTVTEQFTDRGIISVQGPKALELMAEIIPEVSTMKPMRVISSGDIIAATTGYTGSGGGEFIAPISETIRIWDNLLKRGRKYGVQPIGLGARDSLRLEKGFALYGHELTDEIGPIESVSRWTVKLEGRDFVGHSALEKLNNFRHVSPVVVSGGVAREGYKVVEEDKVIGHVTSGTFSPTLKKSIALLLTEKKTKEGDKLTIRIRNKDVVATVVSLPFVK